MEELCTRLRPFLGSRLLVRSAKKKQAAQPTWCTVEYASDGARELVLRAPAADGQSAEGERALARLELRNAKLQGASRLGRLMFTVEPTRGEKSGTAFFFEAESDTEAWAWRQALKMLGADSTSAMEQAGAAQASQVDVNDASRLELQVLVMSLLDENSAMREENHALLAKVSRLSGRGSDQARQAEAALRLVRTSHIAMFPCHATVL